MQILRGITSVSCTCVLVLAAAACTPIVDRHGYAPSQDELENIIVGVDTRDTLRDVIGPPSTSGVVQEDAWYYVESYHSTRGFSDKKEIQRSVVAVSFDDSGTVRNIEEFSLADGRVVTLNRRVTDDNIKGTSFLSQLLGNIGNFTAEQFLDGE